MSTAAKLLSQPTRVSLGRLLMPLRSGWLFRVVHGGVMLGLQDFSIERCCASLLTSLVPGRHASGAQQAAVLRVTLDATAGGEKGDRHLSQSISLRLERLRLERLSQSFSLIPHSLEVHNPSPSLPSPTISGLSLVPIAGLFHRP